MSCADDNRGLPDFLPGRLMLLPGTARDYGELAAFHYAAGPPATWAGVWAIRYLPPRVHSPGHRQDPHEPRTVAVGVLSYPIPSCRPRERWLRLDGPLERKLKFINTHLRTISRIIVHPQFRSLGLSSLLVRCLCDHCDTRFVEALAMMGHVHPLFERAGMIRTNPGRLDEPAHYMIDRQVDACLSHPSPRAA